MKHLKRFNESSSERMTKEEIDVMLDTIEDIFLDIKDDGFRLDYSGPVLKLTITKPKETVLGKMGVTFKLGDITNVVHHLYNYLITIDKLQFNKMSILKIATNRTSSGRSIGMTNYIKIDELDESSDFTIDELTIKFDETFLKDYGLPTASELDDLSGYNESSSYDIDAKLVGDIVKDVMSGYSDDYEFDSKVTNVKDHEHAKWYRKQFDPTYGAGMPFAILEITPDDKMISSRGFSTEYKFNDEWADMLIFLSKHLEDYGYNSVVITHVTNGVSKFSPIQQYVNRVNREKGKWGARLTGETFCAPFSVYITKKGPTEYENHLKK